jgi:hypothetical protein
MLAHPYNAASGMPPGCDPYLVSDRRVRASVAGLERGAEMRRSIVCAGRLALSAGLCGGWLAAVAPAARSAVFDGISAPARAELGPVLPAQAQQGQNVEASVAQLHQQLQITLAQEPTFATFAAAIRENARRSASSPPPTNADAVSQLQLPIQFGQQEVDGMQRPPTVRQYRQRIHRTAGLRIAPAWHGIEPQRQHTRRRDQQEVLEAARRLAGSAAIAAGAADTL